MSPLYLVKLKITQKQQTAYAVHSVEPIVPDFHRKSFNVRLFPCLLENLLHFHGFYQKFIFELNMGNFNT